MRREEFLLIVAAIKTYYPKDNMLPTKEAIELWYQALNDLSYDECSTALRRYVAVGKYPPTIADIREQAAKLKPTVSNEMQAWETVLKAIKRSSYHAEEEYNKLPTLIQKAVGGHRQLREWATSETVDLTVVQSHFIRSYRQELSRQQEEVQLSPQLREAISRAQIAAGNGLQITEN